MYMNCFPEVRICVRRGSARRLVHAYEVAVRKKPTQGKTKQCVTEATVGFLPTVGFSDS